MPKTKQIGTIFAIALLSSLSAGCATNVIRLDRAATMTKAGRIATDATRTVMKDVAIENRALLIDLVASDRNCRFPDVIIAYAKPTAGSTLCRKGPRLKGDQEITRLRKSDYAPSLATIDGLVAYFDAVDSIVTREPLDLEGDFAEAQGNLLSIKNDVSTIIGSDGVPIPTFTADQQAAVGGVLDLFSEIIDEAQRVKELRKIDLEQVAIEGSLQSLDQANDRWVRTLEAQINSRFTLSRLRLPKIPISKYEVRRVAADEQLTLLERQENIAGLKIALKNTVKALRTARTDYRNLLFNYDKTLTTAERRKSAAIVRSRVRAALASLASVIRAF